MTLREQLSQAIYWVVCRYRISRINPVNVNGIEDSERLSAFETAPAPNWALRDTFVVSTTATASDRIECNCGNSNKQPDGYIHHAIPEKRTRIFQAVPDKYKLLEALKKLSVFRWKVNQHQGKIQAGDDVYLWLAGAKGGLVARGSVITAP